MKLKKIALTISASLLVLVGAVTFLPLRAIAGLETPCNYISDLVATNPLSSDLASTGDDHLRCIKSVLKTTFPNINAAVTATDENLNALSASTTAAGILELEAAAPRLIVDETDAAANERIYDFASIAGQLLGRTRTDADAAGASWLTVDRTGTTVDSIALASTALTWNTNTLFTTANDGSGSGLDADLLDGSSSAAFAQLAQSNTFTDTGGGVGASIVSSNATPFFALDESDGAANNQEWDFGAASEQLVFRVLNDAENSIVNWLTVDRTGTTVDSINLLATAVQVNSISITPTSGSFTGTLTGMSGATTGTLFYRCALNSCTVSTGATAQILGTSNTTAFTITGLPAAAQPTSGVCDVTHAVNSGSTVSALFCISGGSGTIAFSILTAGANTYNSSGFTASGNKGVSNWTITYSTL